MRPFSSPTGNLMLILNDIHIGFQRSAGTSPQSQTALREYLFDRLDSTLAESTEDHLLILGDLFDSFEISTRDLIQTYLLLAGWAATRRLTLVAGNHDHSPKGDRSSSFQLLCTVLLKEYPDNVKVVGIDEYAVVAENCIALAHCANQDIFNMKLDEILANHSTCDLLLHANYHNNFAVESDHSLNVSEDQALAFKAKGFTLIFAHEHQARTALNGTVVILGNQWPTSVADCLNNNDKACHRLGDEVLLRKVTWAGGNDEHAPFSYVNWRELGETDLAKSGFIRVTGEASRTEAADVINAIAKFRSRSAAFVITNAVKVEGVVEVQELPDQFEAAKKFDVMDFISKHLTDAEMSMVKELAKEKQ